MCDHFPNAHCIYVWLLKLSRGANFWLSIKFSDIMYRKCAVSSGDNILMMVGSGLGLDLQKYWQVYFYFSNHTSLF